LTHNNSIPIQSNERTVIVDILRGFALFGVLLTNLWGLEIELPEVHLKHITSNLADKITDTTVYVLFLNKFITLFSLLFGYGFGVIIERLVAKGINPVPFFIRRMSILLVLGLIHIGLWWGEILSIYALCGLLLLPFRKAKTQNLLLAAFIFTLMAGPIIQGFRIFFFSPDPILREHILTDYFEITLHGSLNEIFVVNYAMMKELYLRNWVTYRDMLEILGKFLLGYYILRQGYLKNILEHLEKIKKIWKVTLILGLLYAIDKFLIYSKIVEVRNDYFKLFEYVLNNIGVLALAIFYATTLIILYSKRPGWKIFDSLRYVGTMSLTNYLTHTAFYIFIFTGLGLGLIGRLNLFLIIPVSIGIFTFQVLLSKFWMKYYLYGPCEWIWRQLTYGKRLPILRKD
jgi:uncharacterized protein